MIIQLTRAIESLGMRTLGKVRIKVENICFYERTERITGMIPITGVIPDENKEEFTLIVFKGGDNLCVKETPEEIDLLIKDKFCVLTKEEEK